MPLRRLAVALPALVVWALAPAPRAAADWVGLTVSAQANPWLAGMPAGSVANNLPGVPASGDAAPGQAPAEVVGLPLVPGATLTFDATGRAGNGQRANQLRGPDGGPAFTYHVVSFPEAGFGSGAQNGIADYFVPLGSLVGVFLDGHQPNLGPAPAPLDFRPGGNVPGGTDYPTLAPALKQVFFLGDGLTSGGVRQQVVVPDGATRLFLGFADGFQWNNNAGAFRVTVQNAPAPASWVLLGLGTAVVLGCRCRRQRRPRA
jgi:hypothetical protein